MRNLSDLLEKSGAEEKRERLRFYRSLVPNAVLVRGADGFVCGLCGTSHAVRKDGENCLRNCLRARADDGVVTVTALGESYTCPKCGRRFARREDAIDCHGRVRRLSKIFLAQVPEKGAKNWDDSSFAGLKETDKPGKGRLLKLALRLEAMVPFLTSHTFDPSLRSGNSVPQEGNLSAFSFSAESAESERRSMQPNKKRHVSRKVAPASAQQGKVRKPLPMEHHEDEPTVMAAVSHKQERYRVAPHAMAPVDEGGHSSNVEQSELASSHELTPSAPAVALSDEDGPFREKGMKPFTRHDARYKCSVCGKMYFTRSDVENCFFSHPERMV